MASLIVSCVIGLERYLTIFVVVVGDCHLVLSNNFRLHLVNMADSSANALPQTVLRNLGEK